MRRLTLRFALTLCLAATLSAAQAAPLNDTGIDFCSDGAVIASCATVGADSGTHPRQDAVTGRDAQTAAGTLSKVGGGGKGFDFSKIANDGSVLPENAALGFGPQDWACTRDNVTGLIWEVKTNSGLRSQNHTYTWYNSNPATNGGRVGQSSGGTCYVNGRCDTEKFVQDVNAAGLCGGKDWRMPTVRELQGIADLGRFNPAIDPTYFPDLTVKDTFWSDSPVVDVLDSAWMVDFNDGSSFIGGRGNNPGVRLVRGGK